MSWRKKKVYGYKNFCVYFTHLPGSPPWRDLHKILHDGSPRRRNQPCQILSQSGQGFWFCGGSNFWLSHKKEKSPLTQGLNYRSACDKPILKTRHLMQRSSIYLLRKPSSNPLCPKFCCHGNNEGRSGKHSIGSIRWPIPENPIIEQKILQISLTQTEL